MGVDGVQNVGQAGNLPAKKTKQEKIKELARIIGEHCNVFETMAGEGLEIPENKREFVRKKLEEFLKLNKEKIDYPQVIKVSFEKGKYGAVIGGISWSVKGVNVFKANPEKIIERNKRYFKIMKENLPKDFSFLSNSKEAYQEIETWLKKEDSKVLMLGSKHQDPSSAAFLSNDFFRKLKELDCIIAVEIDYDDVNPKNGKTSEQEFKEYNANKNASTPSLLFNMARSYPMIAKLTKAHQQGLEIYPVDSYTTVIDSIRKNPKTLKFEPKVTRDEIMSKKIQALLKEHPGKKIVFLGGAAHCLGKGTGTPVVCGMSELIYDESKMLASRLEEALGDNAVLNVLLADEAAIPMGTKLDFKDYAHNFPDKFRFSSVVLEPEDPNVRKWLETLPKAESKFLKTKEFYREVKNKTAMFVPVYRASKEGKAVSLFDMLVIPRE